MLKVTLRNGETTEKLLQRFKRSVSKEGILKEIKKRGHFEKPSEGRRRRAREQEKLLRKKARKKAMKDARKRARRRT
ncbi:MAG: 30S ribosomal protein S21 [Planctomycetes bacterium]|nr:30S ribosomal protein S21 [Planctomycetota bacterium]